MSRQASRDAARLEFAEFYTTCRRRVLRFAERRLPADGTAEDITAEVFAAAWRVWERGERVELAWLYRVAANKVADLYRTKSRLRILMENIAEAEDNDNWASEMDRLELAEALSALTLSERDVILLTYWERLSAKEVAAVVGGTEARVWKLLSRARVRLRSFLLEEPMSLARGEKFLPNRRKAVNAVG